MLEVDGIHTFYAQSHILFGVSLRVEPGKIICLLGRNGAGKTTTLRSIMGLTPPRRGSIRFKGEDIAGKPPYLLARKGISYVPDDRRIFADLTVSENLEIAEARYDRGITWSKARVYDLFPILKTKESHKGGHLSGGEQKMLAIGRALMVNPVLLLLDEPMEGLAPLLVRSFEEQILKLRESGLTVLLAEQNIVAALHIGDYCYVIDDGKILSQGTVKELRENVDIRRRYLQA